jgi:hypothetical protein
VESLLAALSSISKDPDLARLREDIKICEPGRKLFFFQHVSDQEVERLLHIPDQAQQRLFEIEQINFMLVALILISTFSILALVFWFRAGIIRALGVVWKSSDYKLSKTLLGIMHKKDPEEEVEDAVLERRLRKVREIIQQ